MYDPYVDEPKVSCGRKRCTWVCLWLLLVGACLVFIAGFLGPFGLNKYFQIALKQTLVISSTDSPGFAAFADNTQADSVPIWFSAYVWNLTNPREFELGLEKPKLNEVGPYVFRENVIKFNFSFPDNGNEMRYLTWKYFVYDPDQSIGDPYVDRVTTVNVPFQAVRAGLGGDTWWGNLAFDVVASMTNATLLTEQTVRDLVFGYNDTLLEFVSKLQPGTPIQAPLQVNLTSKDNTAQTTKYDTFYTGQSDLSQIMQYKEWQENTTLTVWGSDEANTVYGTDASQFAPGTSDADQLVAFVDTLFRKVDFTANYTIEVEGITLWRFGLLVADFANVTYIPSNAAYYAFGPIGVLNLTSAQSGAPVFLSKPHFLDADQLYRDAVIGMEPSYDLHNTYIDVEPTIGTTMQATKRLQLNVRVAPQLLLYPNVTETLVPVVWFEEKATINSALAGTFKGSVYLLQTIVYYAKWVGIIGGAGLIALMLIVMVALRVHNVRKDPDTHYLRQRLATEGRGDPDDRSPLLVNR
eukprot:TRINITY_DN19228_c0_g1_i1.p1 TRINITY_DN19228_c0_g1~~TRINITY_DN19228_c0_g1_i1.p1  ORF type:complete len:523 (+),score=192.33 TRINITY_DN19228_c0_g1_i1:150-1718(+)